MENLVREHYNERQERSRAERERLSTIALRKYNNNVKRAWIERFASALEQGAAVDLAGGKGGDLHKWAALDALSHLSLVDCAPRSVEQAAQRYEKTVRAKRPALQFFTLCDDMANEKLLALLPCVGAYDLVSCMFALHYVCDTEQRLSQTLYNVSHLLRAGGLFIGAAPYEDQIRAFPDRNALCRVEWRNERSYWFTLRDAVDRCLEYVVPWPLFVSLAAEHALELVECKPFAAVTLEGAAELSADERDVANLYVAFALRKKK